MQYKNNHAFYINFAFCFSMRHKLTTTLRPYDLIGHLNHNEEHIQIYAYANLVLTTINNFVVSNSAVMGLNHVPFDDFNRQTISHANRDVRYFILLQRPKVKC